MQFKTRRYWERALEIINGEPRRRRSDEEKLAILAEALEFGSVSRVARRHGLNPSMVFAWRKKFSQAQELPDEQAHFSPVALIQDSASPLQSSSPAMSVMIGAEIRVSIVSGVDPALAAAVASALAPFAFRR